MSAKLMNQVFTLDLAPELKYVLLALASHAADDGSDVFPSVARLAGMCSLTGRSINRALVRLRALGILVTVAAGGGSGRTTRYRLDLNPDAHVSVSPPGTLTPATETLTPASPNPDAHVRGIVRESSERDSLRGRATERADVGALLERGWRRVTKAQRAVLDEVLDRHDVTGPGWAAAVIRATPPDADPLAAVMDADRAWQREQAARADAEEASAIAARSGPRSNEEAAAVAGGFAANHYAARRKAGAS